MATAIGNIISCSVGKITLWNEYKNIENITEYSSDVSNKIPKLVTGLSLRHKAIMVIVRTRQGFVKGVCKRDGVTYHAFKGIPYARPPLGDLRFKAPEPPEPWTGIRDASQHGPVCPQYNERLDRIETGSEDCLYLNVYSKNIIPSNPLPVMIWIHGGSFYTGSGDSDFYGPEFFMAHDMVLVTFNYRLEIFGFLCLDIDEVPGNAGLKDQVAALRWIKSNIRSFGGDPDNITLFGCSAGSAATSYHLLSKMSNGLFNKAICQSGTCLNEWACNLYGKERAFQLAKLLGMDTKDPIEVLHFLRQVPKESLINVNLPALEHELVDVVDGIAFSPVIEKDNLNTEKFITEMPYNLIKDGHVSKVPVIFGYTSGEGIEIARNLPHMVENLAKVGFIVPRDLKFKLSEKELKKVDDKIRKQYFDSRPINKEMFQEISDLETFRLFAYNILRFARYHSRTSPVYVYKFCVETERNFYKRKYKMDALKGVCHADDLHYFFNVTNLEIPLTENSKFIIKQIVELWFNFAAGSDPTPSSSNRRSPIKWKPYTEKDRHCFIIDRNFKLETNVDENDIKFWEDIYNEADRK